MLHTEQVCVDQVDLDDLLWGMLTRIISVFESFNCSKGLLTLRIALLFYVFTVMSALGQDSIDIYDLPEDTWLLSGYEAHTPPPIENIGQNLPDDFGSHWADKEATLPGQLENIEAYRKWKDEMRKKERIDMLLAVLFISALLLVPILVYRERLKRKHPSNALTKLEGLRAKGLLSETEYKAKSAKVLRQIAELSIKDSTEYKSLRQLQSTNVITKEEFQEKINLLIDESLQTPN